MKMTLFEIGVNVLEIFIIMMFLTLYFGCVAYDNLRMRFCERRYRKNIYYDSGTGMCNSNRKITVDTRLCNTP